MLLKNKKGIVLSNTLIINIKFLDMSNLENNNENTENVNSNFPVNAFPEIIQEVIMEYNRVLNFNVHYIGASILFALSLAVGNYIKLTVNGDDWIESPILWLVLVGKPGINKTAPLKTFIKLFKLKDKDSYEEYKKHLEEYERKVKEFKKRNRKKIENEELEMPILPKRIQTLISDFTPEAMSEAHENNPRGLGIYSDELLTWLKNFSRYSSSGEEQMFLSIWNGHEINVNRRSTPHIYISSSFIPVAGTIQPDQLLVAFGKNRAKNGFTHRLLFAYPDEVVREDLPRENISKTVKRAYNELLEGIIDMSKGKSLSNLKMYTLSDESFDAFTEIRKRNNTRINKDKDGELSGIFSKMDSYLLRIALILQVLDDCENKRENSVVDAKWIYAAAKFTSYFEYTAIKVHKLISRYDDPLGNYSNDKRQVYKSLPSDFKTEEGIKIAEDNGMPERTFKDFIKDDNLFEKLKHGLYSKKI